MILALIRRGNSLEYSRPLPLPRREGPGEGELPDEFPIVLLVVSGVIPTVNRLYPPVSLPPPGKAARVEHVPQAVARQVEGLHGWP